MDRIRGSHRSSAENTEKGGNMEKLEESKGGLFLANPNACEEDGPTSTSKKLSTSNSLIAGDSKERLFVKGKSRSKSPSFFKMLVGGLRKLSTHELEDTEDRHTTGESSSFSDTDEPVSVSPLPVIDDSQRIGHFATLPRSKKSSQKESNSSSPEENRRTEVYPVYQYIPENRLESPDRDQTDNALSDSPLLSDVQSDYQSIGLEALEMLHNQLQILVIQDCDDEMADVMHDKVTESLQKQVSDLQKSLDCLQKSDQNLRLSLKMAEMRAHEAEIKLHHNSINYKKLEEQYRWLEKEYRNIHIKHHDLEKYLQKRALLNQMQLSPSRNRQDNRPNSDQQPRRQRSYEHFSPHVSPVKRHNSTEFLYQQKQRQQQAINVINPCNTLPTRLHSGSLSHTETRV